MTAINGARVRSGFVVGKGRHVTGQERADLTAMLVAWYAQGASIRQLSDRTGRSYQTVRNMLTEAGVELRPRGGRRPPPLPEPCQPQNPDIAYARALGHELRRLRRARGWTRARMCRDLTISVQTLATYENGTRALAATRLAELCAVLSTQPHVVLATVDRAVLPVRDSLTVDLEVLAATTDPDLAPVRRWAVTRLRCLVPGRSTMTSLDSAALAQLASLCGRPVSELVTALRALPPTT